MHTLIISPRDCLKHDFIRRITTALGRPVYGYETQRESDIKISFSIFHRHTILRIYDVNKNFNSDTIL